MNYYSLLFILLASISSLNAMEQPTVPQVQPDLQVQPAAQEQSQTAKTWFWQRGWQRLRGNKPAQQQQPVVAQPTTPAQPNIFRRTINGIAATKNVVVQMPNQLNKLASTFKKTSKEVTDKFTTTADNVVKSIKTNLDNNIPSLIKQTAFTLLGAFIIGASFYKLGIPAIKLYTKSKDSWRNYTAGCTGLSALGLGLIAKSKTLADWLS